MDSWCHQVAVVYSKRSFNISLKLRWCEYSVWLQAGGLEEVFSSSVCPDRLDGHSASCSVFGLFLLTDRCKKSKREPGLDTPYTSKWKSFWPRAKSLTFIIQREVLRKRGIQFCLSNQISFSELFLISTDFCFVGLCSKTAERPVLW